MLLHSGSPCCLCLSYFLRAPTHCAPHCPASRYVSARQLTAKRLTQSQWNFSVAFWETPYLLAMQPFSLEAILIMHLELYTSHTVKFWSTGCLGRHCSDHVTVGALVSIGLLPAVAVRLQESVRVVQSHSPSPPMSYRNQGATIEAQNPMTGMALRTNYMELYIQTYPNKEMPLL